MVSKNTKLEKEITFLIKVMNGGGAERVITILSNALVEKGYTVNLILTHQKLQDAVIDDVHKNIQVYSLEDMTKEKQNKVVMLYARLLGKLSKAIYKKESEIGLIYKYYARNFAKVSWLKHYFKMKKQNIAIAFMYDSIFLTLLSRRKKDKVFISERGAPQDSMQSHTTRAFFHKLFPRANKIVFQSPDVKKWYFDNMNLNGEIIYNPIKDNLPPRHIGPKKNRIVNFCRISHLKNLEMLINGFIYFQRDYPEYELYIYGNSDTEESIKYEKKIQDMIETSNCACKIHLYPARTDIHEEIKDYKMFVSTSDFEGMSNSMLEAMAMGMCVICTDCPAGGARAVINNYENGILIPVKDTEKLYYAMKQIVENSELEEKLGNNAMKIKNELSINNIILRWITVIEG